MVFSIVPDLAFEARIRNARASEVCRVCISGCLLDDRGRERVFTGSGQFPDLRGHYNTAPAGNETLSGRSARHVLGSNRPFFTEGRWILRRVRIVVDGMVQGVGFRYFTRNLARSLNLTGFVRNTRDGRVETEAQGAPEQVGAFINGVRTGPSRAMVSGVEVEDIPEAPGEEGFEVRF